MGIDGDEKMKAPSIVSLLHSNFCEKVDVIICTKDRPIMAHNAIVQAKNLIPYHNMIIVESSEKPKIDMIRVKGVNIKFIFTPNATLGYARQQGLLLSSSPYVVYLDDDIILEKKWFKKMMKTFTPKVIAVSSRVVYGYQTDSVLLKLYSKGRPPKAGGSGGVAIFDRQKILSVGGYNPEMHWGEDAELQERMRKNGYRWIRQLNAYAYHPCTFKESLARAKRNGLGMASVWKHYPTSLLRIMIKQFGRIFVMPIYYTLQTLEPRILAYYFLYHWLFLKGLIGGLRYE